MSSSNTLRIGYVNAQGYSLKAHEVCCSYIHTQQLDIICISETWFTNRSTYQSNSFFLDESLYPNQPHLNRRQDGGLLILINPLIRTNYSITYKSRYSLAVQDLSTSTIIAFTYLPPSLDADTVLTELISIGKCNALIGDLNIRLGAQSGDSITTAPTRRTAISTYITKNSLNYLRNSNLSETSRTDHIYTDLASIHWEYIRSLDFRSDHGLMKIFIQLKNHYRPTTSTLGSPRFNFKPLFNPLFAEDFTISFNEIHGSAMQLECEAALDTCCHSIILPSTEETQLIIDATYASFVDTITTHLDRSLTRYDAHEVKARPDPLLDGSSDPPRSVLQTIRTFKRSQRAKAAKSPIISSDPTKSPLEECTHHYSKQYYSNEETPKIHRQNDTQFGLLFTNEMIARCVKRYSLVKSMGPDGIHTVALKALVDSRSFLQSISALFQLFASTGLVPSSWSQCNLHLLIKKQDQPSTASNTRPIALSPILRRIFEKMLMKIWNHQSTQESEEMSWIKLNPGQAGFRRGYSTLSHLILSDELSRHNCPFSVFLDIKGAFDSVSWAKLNNLLIARKCPPTQRNLILSLICTPAELLLSVNQSEREIIKTKKGVFQGGGISALIFAIYIDPLANELNEGFPPHSPLALLYADDVQLKPKSSYECQVALDKCTKYATAFDMQWSIPKCSVVGPCDSDQILAGSVLPRSDSYKYLGAKHRANGVDWRNTYIEATAKQMRLITALSDRNWHPRMRLIIYRTFIRPINEYTAVLTWIWAQKDLNSRSDLIKLMETSHKDALKWIFNRRRHLKLLDYMSGFGPWTHRMESLKASLVFSMKKMNASNPLIAARAFYMVSTSKHFIMPECFKSDYVTAYQRVKTQNKTLSWKTWKNRQLEILRQTASQSSALITYYSPVLNTDRSSPIFLLDWNTFDLILNWRSNNTLLHRTCTCSQSFNRSHLDCVLAGNPLFDSSVTNRSFKSASRKILTASNSTRQLTLLDHLLNSCKHDEFLELFKNLSCALDGSISTQSPPNTLNTLATTNL